MARTSPTWTEERILLASAVELKRNDRLQRNSDHIELIHDEGDFVIATTRVGRTPLAKTAEVYVWRTTICY